MQLSSNLSFLGSSQISLFGNNNQLLFSLFNAISQAEPVNFNRLNFLNELIRAFAPADAVHHSFSVLLELLPMIFGNMVDVVIKQDQRLTVSTIKCSRGSFLLGSAFHQFLIFLMSSSVHQPVFVSIPHVSRKITKVKMFHAVVACASFLFFGLCASLNVGFELIHTFLLTTVLALLHI